MINIIYMQHMITKSTYLFGNTNIYNIMTESRYLKLQEACMYSH